MMIINYIKERIGQFLCFCHFHSWKEISKNYYFGKIIFRYKCQRCGKTRVDDF